jgi:hypothetical protein
MIIAWKLIEKIIDKNTQFHDLEYLLKLVYF